jgi:hypothetical protein
MPPSNMKTLNIYPNHYQLVLERKHFLEVRDQRVWTMSQVIEELCKFHEKGN